MYEDYAELEVEGLTHGSELHDTYILVMKEKGGGNFYPVLVSESEHRQLVHALRDREYTCSRLMNKLAARVGMKLTGARLMQPRGGRTEALIDFELLGNTISFTATAAEATIATLEAEAPMWVHRNALKKQSRRTKDGGVSLALPLSAMKDSLLREALQSAAKEENYELAGVLRDELKKRAGAGAAQSGEEGEGE